MNSKQVIIDNYENIGFKDLGFLIIFVLSGSVFPILSSYILKFLTDSLMHFEWKCVMFFVIIQILVWGILISINSYEQNVRQKVRTKAQSHFQLMLRKKLYNMTSHYLSVPDNIESFSMASKNPDIYLDLFWDIISILIKVPALAVAVMPFIKVLPNAIILLAVSCGLKLMISLKCSELEYLNTVKQLEVERKRNYYKELFYSNLTNKEIKSFDASKWLLGKYDETSKAVFKETSNLHKNNTKKFIMTDIMAWIFDMLIRGFIVLQIIDSSFPVSDCLLLFGLWENAVSLTEELQFNLTETRAHLHTYKDVQKFFGLSDTNNNGVEVDRIKQITLSNISFSYPSKISKEILKNINLEFETNKSYLVLGENGAGKSTLMKLLLNQYKAQQGIITVNGEYELSCLKKIKIGYMAQDNPHFTLTLKENIIFGNDFDKDKFIYAIRKAGLEQFVNSLPQRENTLLGLAYGEGRELSGGEWQRISFARLLYNENDIIILDEPTANLDPIAEKNLFQKIKEIFFDKIVIMVSHRLNSVNFVDKIIYIDDGKVKDVGNHAELYNRCPKYKNLFDITEEVRGGIKDED